MAPQAPQPQASAPDQHLDAMAKAHGFPDYATMAAWYRNRSQGLQQPDSGGSAAGGLQDGFRAAMMLHPANLLDYAMRKYHEAVGQ